LIKFQYSEQRRIAKILSTVDKKLELERRSKEKLERVKKGLMNDLLIGKKRVAL
jgi:type I restriction enzyme S subunit